MSRTKKKKKTVSKYRIRFIDPGHPLDNKYFSYDVDWNGVEKENASILSHADAVRIVNHFKRPGLRIASIIEPVE